jgi:hypothetical protein
MALWCVSQNWQHLLCTSCLQSAYTQNKYQRWHSGKTLRFELQETGASSWRSGVLAQDNNIYYMPYHAHRIMRLNPDNDSLSSVGDDLRRGVFGKYRGTVVGNDDCVYGIPYDAKRIVKFDPTNPDTTSTAGEEADGYF